MTGGQAARAASRLLPNLGPLAVFGGAIAFGAYAASESLRPLAFQFVVAPLAIALSVIVGLCMLTAGVVAGALHRPRARRWLFRVAGLVFAGTVLGLVGGLAILSPPPSAAHEDAALLRTWTQLWTGLFGIG